MRRRSTVRSDVADGVNDRHAEAARAVAPLVAALGQAHEKERQRRQRNTQPDVGKTAGAQVSLNIRRCFCCDEVLDASHSANPCADCRHASLAAAEERAQKAEGLVVQLREALREREWTYSGVYCCQTCDGWEPDPAHPNDTRYGHKPGCVIPGLLGESE